MKNYLDKQGLSRYNSSLVQKLKSIFALHGETATDAQVATAVTSWLNTNVDPVGSAVVVDNTLLIEGAAADAKKTGEEVTDLKNAFDEMVGLYEFIHFPDISYHGISIVKSGDSYVTSGLSDQAINLTLGSFTLKAEKTYIFDSGISDPSVTAYYLYLIGINGTTTWYRTGDTFTCSADSTVYIKIYCDNNTTLGASFCPVVAEYPTLSTKNLQSEINATNDELVKIENVLPKDMVLETVVDADSDGWESGYFYSAGAQNILTKSAYSALSCKYYGPVTAGEKFTITARSAGSGYAIILCNSSNIVIDTLVSQTSYYEDKIYTVPYNGLMYLNTIAADYLSGAKKYKLSKYVPQYKDLSSVLKGIKWYTLGDSLSEFNSTAETNWIKYMIASTEIDNVNLAKSGAGFYRGSPLEGQTQINYIKQLESVESDAELITIAGSFNDLMSNPWTTLPVGTASDSGTTTIAGYMNAFFDELLTNFPTVPIGVYMTSPWDIYKPGVTEADAYVSVLKTICETRGIPFYTDCYYGCNLKPWLAANKTEYYTRTGGYVDGVHPNSKGHIYIYRMIKPFLEKIANTSK